MWELQALGLTETAGSLGKLSEEIDDPETFLAGTGARMTGADVRENFQEGGRPVKWTDITARSRAKRRVNKSSGPLIDSEALEDAASADHAGVAGSLFSVQGDTLTEGTDLFYAAVQEYGWTDKNVPARSYEQITAEDEIRLSQAMEDDWLHRLLAAM